MFILYTLGGAPLIWTKNHVRLQHTLETPYVQVLFCRIKGYIHNFDDKSTRDNMYT